MKASNFFRDSQGKIVIAQWPNWPLWLAIFFFCLQFVPNDLIQDISFWGLLLSLCYWSFLEIFYGVNTWRRVLGIIILGSQILKLVRLA